MDRSGRQVGSIGEPGYFGLVRISPDGGRLVADVENPATGGRDLWLYDLSTGIGSRLTVDPVSAGWPAWSPDGDRVAFGSGREGPPDMYVKDLGGPLAEKLLFAGSRPAGALGLDAGWTVHRVRGSPPQPEGQEPDLAAADDRGAQTRAARRQPVRRVQAEVLAGLALRRVRVGGHGAARGVRRGVDGGGRKQRISPAGGSLPCWSADGKELFFQAADNVLMTVAVRLGQDIQFSAPKPLFSLPPFQPFPLGGRLRRVARRTTLPGQSRDGAREPAAVDRHPRLAAAPRGRRVSAAIGEQPAELLVSRSCDRFVQPSPSSSFLSKFSFFLCLSSSLAAGERVVPSRLPSGEMRLPNGRLLTPTGTQTEVAPYPFALALTPDGKRVVVACTGADDQSLHLLDAATGKVAREGAREEVLARPRGVSGRLARLPRGRGREERPRLPARRATASSPRSRSRSGSATSRPKLDATPSGLAVSPDGKSLWVARILLNDVVRIDLASRVVAARSRRRPSLPAGPLAGREAPRRRELGRRRP